MNDLRMGTLQRLGMLACFLAAAPWPAAAQPVQAEQACEMGTISEITFERQKPFLPEATSEEATLGWLFRGMNSIHILTREGTIHWELLFEEGDCLDPELLQESERNLRSLPYIAEARVRSEQLPDGSHRVDITTLDGWSLTVGVVIEIQDGLQISGISVTAKNLVGTGTSVGYFRNTFRERQRIGGLARQPNFFGTRFDVTFHGGNTRTGKYYSESLYRPFTGEVGQNAFRQSAHKRDDDFAWSVDPSLPFTQALVRFEAERYELVYERRFGNQEGLRFLGGIGVSREVVQFPFGVPGFKIVEDNEFGDPIQAPMEVAAAVSSQINNYEMNRVSFTVGVRDLRFGTRLGLDAITALQDVQLGTDLTLTVAPGLSTGDDNPSDVLTQFKGSTGLAAGRLYVLSNLDFQARYVSADEDGDGDPLGWRSILWELNGIAYWNFSETSTLLGRIQYASGSRMDRPYQLTLGGREAVRSYNDDAFPGAQRFLATLEQRIPFPRLSSGFADLGLAGFVDVGKMWAGDVPFGADSGWEAGVGAGIRIGLPAGGHSVLRLDFTIPMTGQREESGVGFRLYTELFGLLDRRSWPTQTERSRWYGIDPDLTQRPVNPLAGN